MSWFRDTSHWVARPRLEAAAAVLAAICVSRAEAQTLDFERIPLGTTLSANLFRDLPSSDNLFALLETTQPTLITDRFLGGGLYTGQGARVGGFLSSWTQTQFRIDGISVSDPTGSGQPLLFPSLPFWSSIRVGTGLLDTEVAAVGLAISLDPQQPGARWSRRAEMTTSHFSTTLANPAPINRLAAWDRGAMVASGPIIENRLGLVVGGSWTRGSQIDRAETAPVSSDVGAAFAHAVFNPTDQDEIRTIGWLQRSRQPFEYRLPFGQPASTSSGGAGHVQSTWDHRGAGGTPLRFAASYTRREEAPAFDSRQGATVERLADGPPSQLAGLAAAGERSIYRWSVGGRAGAPAARNSGNRHTLFAGADAFGGGSRGRRFFSGDVFELVGGQPARLWRFVSPGIESFRHQMGVLAYVSDRLRIGPLNLETGLRYDAVSGAAEGAETGIEWASLLPRVALDLTAARFSIFTGLLRSAYQLPLDWLAVGDPAAPTADVFRWETSTAATISPLIARAGPGTGGRPGFAGIDSNLERPSTDEFVLGFEIRPTPTTRLRLTGMNRRERNIVGTVNTAMPPYDAGGVFDPGGNVGSPDDDRIVPFYSRQPAGFGRDRYLLTNLGLDDATFKGLELTASLNRDRMTLFFGATAGRAEIFGANRGFGPLENDQGVLGELGIDPNAAVFARGRPFSDRGYTAKLLGIYRFPSATTLGVIARYQDGQPFSRMLLRPELAQGPDAVRAFASGDSRFMFVGTLDARLQQGLPLGGGGLDLVLDAYNLLNLSNSVEELTTEAPDVRIGRVVQPPRSVHIGVRITF